MDDEAKLKVIEEELNQLYEKLGKLFPQSHPRFDDVFENLGAAGYYMRKAGYEIKGAIAVLKGDLNNE